MAEGPGAAALWTWDELVASSGGSGDGVPTAEITGFSIDTRSLARGEVFVALKDQRDGHDFVTTAFARGAAAALVSESYAKISGDGALILVREADDGPLGALRRIGAAARARLSSGARVIAVTGSAGKTGTTAMLGAALSSVGKTHAPEKSFNNHWGVPLTLARMPRAVAFAVLEIGMNHENEIRPLVKLVRPHIAIVTNVLPVHVGNFADGEIGVGKAKAEIFEGLEPGGVAILPRDNPHYNLLEHKARACGARVRSFGASADSDAYGHGGRWLGEVECPTMHVTAQVKASDGWEEITYELGTPGSHIVTNSMSVVLALQELGCLDPISLRPLANVRPPPGRGHRTVFTGSNLLLIDESYNANPRSMHEAIAVLGSVLREQRNRRIAVIGDMLELGRQAEQFHRELKGSLQLFAIDRVFACGPNMKHLHESLAATQQGGWAPTSAGLIGPVLAELRAGDVVMVKGSLGSRMAPVVEAIKERFGERGVS